MQTLLWAAGGTGFTFFMTALGAAVVFFFKERINSNIQRIFCPICIQMQRSRKGLPAPGNGQPCWCWR